MPDAYDYISLMCRLKAAQTRNKELESGEHYIKLKELHQKECRAYERKIQALLTEIADAHKETIRVRNYWFQVLEDMLLEFEAMQKKADQKLREMEKRALLAERQRDDALEKAKEFRLKFYETATQLEEEQGKNLKLHLFLLQKPSGGKRLQTAGKKQDGNPVDSQDIKGMAEKSRSLHIR